MTGFYRGNHMLQCGVGVGKGSEHIPSKHQESTVLRVSGVFPLPGSPCYSFPFVSWQCGSSERPRKSSVP